MEKSDSLRNKEMDAFFSMTATSLFILPLVKADRDRLILNGFENAYIKDEMCELAYPNSFYLLFRPANLLQFNEFVEEERARGYLVDEYDYPDGWTMLVYKYESKWEKDVALIMQGKFSQVSPAYKHAIPRLKETKEYGTVMTMQHHIFDKDDFIKAYIFEKYTLELGKDDEHWQFYSDREVFNKDKLDKLV